MPGRTSDPLAVHIVPRLPRKRHRNVCVCVCFFCYAPFRIRNGARRQPRDFTGWFSREKLTSLGSSCRLMHQAGKDAQPVGIVPESH